MLRKLYNHHLTILGGDRQWETRCYVDTWWIMMRNVVLHVYRMMKTMQRWHMMRMSVGENTGREQHRLGMWWETWGYEGTRSVALRGYIVRKMSGHTMKSMKALGRMRSMTLHAHMRRSMTVCGHTVRGRLMMGNLPPQRHTETPVENHRNFI